MLSAAVVPHRVDLVWSRRDLHHQATISSAKKKKKDARNVNHTEGKDCLDFLSEEFMDLRLVGGTFV